MWGRGGEGRERGDSERRNGERGGGRGLTWEEQAEQRRGGGYLHLLLFLLMLRENIRLL